MKGLSGYVRLRRAPDASLVAFKASADVVSKLVTLVVTVAAARTLSPADFGVMAFAMTTGWLLGVASDAGLPMHLATTVARGAARGVNLSPIVQDVVRWRAGFAVAAIGAGVAFALSFVGAGAVLPFTLIVVHQVAGATLDTVAHVYRGLGRTEVESSLVLAHRGAIAVGALMVLAFAPSLLLLALALAAPPLATLVVSLGVAGRLAGSHGTAMRDSHRARNGRAPSTEAAPRALAGDSGISMLDRRVFVSEVAPLGLGVLLSALYFRCDVFFLERWWGLETVGVYNSAFRIVDALRLFPAAALAVAYPALCAASDGRPVARLSATLVAGALVAATAIVVTASPLLAVVYGERYAEGGGALRVLAFCLPLFFLNYALTHQLIAWEGRRAYLRITATALAVNLVGNALLIPRLGMEGAALSTLITEVVVCGGCGLALRRT